MIGQNVGLAVLLAATPAVSPVDSVRTELTVSCLTWGSGAVTARLRLRRMPEILRVEVSHDSARAVLWDDPERFAPHRTFQELHDHTGSVARVLDAPRRVREEESYAEVR